jgi:hypothetical protein
MATITFHCNAATNVSEAQKGVPSSLIHNDKGSGLGFFGAGFGLSVPVGQYQEQTYVTNANGTSSGIQSTNTRFSTTEADSAGIPHSGMFFSNDSVHIGNSGLPNHMAPLNVRFEHNTDAKGVKVQNCKMRIFDRTNINKHASGVTTKAYEVRRPYPVKNYWGANAGALKLRGDVGDHKWNTWDHEADSSVIDMNFTASPGPSGLNTSSDDPLLATDGSHRNWISKSGESCRAKRHDWYVAISASPNEIGSKTDFGMYFTVEYL